MTEAVANPQAGGAGVPAGREPILEVRDLVKHFPLRAGFLRRVAGEVHAVCGVSFDVAARETVAIVGESGSGKSVTALSIMRLILSSSDRISMAKKAASSRNFGFGACRTTHTSGRRYRVGRVCDRSSGTTYIPGYLRRK